jgi:ubiquinone/menaquinone biosynthesis C-methylase UbiE
MAQRMQSNLYAGSGPELYQRYMVGPIFGPWAAELLADGTPSPGERVLDVACGTGAVTRLAAERVGTAGHVVGLDISPGMLAMARSLSAPWIEWHESSATTLPLPDGAFDLVVCQQGLQFFPDRPAALREMRRVLAAGGRVALSIFCASAGHDVLTAAVAPHVGVEAARLLLEPFNLADRAEIEALLVGAGFKDVTIRRVARVARFPVADHFIETQLAGRPANAVAALPDAARKALLDDARAAFRPFVDADGLAFQMESHLAVAHI